MFINPVYAIVFQEISTSQLHNSYDSSNVEENKLT